MKRGTKEIVFIASMALTSGSLTAFFGPRYHRHWASYQSCHNGNIGNNSCSDWEQRDKTVPPPSEIK
jgi:hypothetical protein